MKCLLVNPVRTGSDSYITPPLHLLYVGGALRKAGVEVEIFDCYHELVEVRAGDRRPKAEIEAEIIAEVASRDFDLFGVGSIVSAFDFSRRLVNAVKAHRPDVPVVVGGNMAMPLKDLWFTRTRVDFLVESDGELVMPALVAALSAPEQLARIPGLHVRTETGFTGLPPELPKDLDYIDFPDWDMLPHLDSYKNILRTWLNRTLPKELQLKPGEHTMPVVMTRGCPFRCMFCFHLNSDYRKHSIAYLMRYFRLLKEKHGVTTLQTWDDLIMLNRQWLSELCDALIAENLGLRIFTSGGKPNLMRPDMLRKMKKAGFFRISYGIESGSQRILDIMRKKTTVEQNAAAVRETVKADMYVHMNLVLGMPGENISSLRETKSFLTRLAKDRVISRANASFAWATGYPGTELWEHMKAHGHVADTEEYLRNQTGVGDYRVNFSGTSVRNLNLMYNMMVLALEYYDHLHERDYAKAAHNRLYKLPRAVLAAYLPVPVKAALKRLASGGARQ